jgi:hypothetical protein
MSCHECPPVRAAARIERGIGDELELRLDRVAYLTPAHRSLASSQRAPRARFLRRLRLPHRDRAPTTAEHFIVHHVGGALDHHRVARAVDHEIHDIAERLGKLERDTADGVYAQPQQPRLSPVVRQRRTTRRVNRPRYSLADQQATKPCRPAGETAANTLQYAPLGVRAIQVWGLPESAELRYIFGPVREPLRAAFTVGCFRARGFLAGIYVNVALS